MLSNANLSKIIWGEAVRTKINIINLSLVYALEMDVIERLRTRRCQLHACESFRMSSIRSHTER